MNFFAPCSALTLGCSSRECVSLSVDGIEMSSRDAQPGEFELEELSGWDDGSGFDGGPAPHQIADGGVEGLTRATGRTITVAGVMRAHDAAHRAQMREDLGAVLAATRWAPLVVWEEMLGLERQIRVTRRRPAMMTNHGDKWCAFTLELESAEWRRTSTTMSTLTLRPGESGPVANAGNANADLAMVMTGPLDNPGITWPGGSWTYRGYIGSGNQINVDFARRVVRNPTTGVHSRPLAVGSWPQIAPGSRDFTATGTGSGRIELRWWDSWS